MSTTTASLKKTWARCWPGSASKLGNPVSQAVNEGHYSRRWLMLQTDTILTRLRTDFLDILYLHRD